MVAGEIIVSKVGKFLQSWSTVYLAGKWALVLNLVFGSGKELHPLEQNVCTGQGSVIFSSLCPLLTPGESECTCL